MVKNSDSGLSRILFRNSECMDMSRIIDDSNMEEIFPMPRFLWEELNGGEVDDAEWKDILRWWADEYRFAQSTGSTLVGMQFVDEEAS